MDRVNSFLQRVARSVGLPRLLTLFVLAVVAPVISLALSLVVGWAVEKVFLKPGATSVDLLLFPMLGLGSVLAYAGVRVLSSNVLQEVRKQARDLLFGHLLEIPARDLINRAPGSLDTLCQEASFAARSLFGAGLPFVGRALGVFGGALILVLLTAPKLALFYVGWGVIYVPYAIWTARRAVVAVGQSLLASAEVSGSSTEVIQNLDLVQSFGSQQYESNRFRGLLNIEHAAYARAQNKIDISDCFQRLLQILPAIGIYVLLAQYSDQLHIDLGEAVGQLTFALMLGLQTGELGRGLLDIQEMRRRLGTALHALSWSHEAEAHTKGLPGTTPTTWDIELRDVHFQYPNAPKALRGISLRIAEGEKIGIVGPSGAGKTTMVRIMRDKLRPQSGEVLIGGCRLVDLSPRVLATEIAEVSQSAPVFHRSIRDNVTYGQPVLSEERIWDVLEKAKLADYVRSLPEGLNTCVGAGGQKLSGGERARLAIARALYFDAKIVVLDEATASLDLRTESAVMEGLEALMHGRTVICITHRPSLMKEMHRIFRLSEGLLSEEPRETPRAP